MFAQVTFRFSFVSVALIACSGLTCPAGLGLPEVDINSVMFDTFEYRLERVEFDDEIREHCPANPGDLQRILISKLSDGVLFELYVIDEGSPIFLNCDIAYSSNDQCRTVRREISRMLSQDEIELVSDVVSRVQSSVDEPLILPPDLDIGCSAIVPCYGYIYVRDDESYGGSGCDNYTDYPDVSFASTERVAEMIQKLREAESD